MRTSKPLSDIMPPSWHEQELARRETLYKAGKVPVYDWADVKTRLEARHRGTSRLPVT